MSQSSRLPQNKTAKFTFWQGVLIAFISIGTTILTVGVLWGGAMARLNYIEAQSRENKLRIEQINADVNQKLETIKTTMVNKDDFRDLKTDVKELIKRK